MALEQTLNGIHKSTWNAARVPWLSASCPICHIVGMAGHASQVHRLALHLCSRCFPCHAKGLIDPTHVLFVLGTGIPVTMPGQPLSI